MAIVSGAYICTVVNAALLKLLYKVNWHYQKLYFVKFSI